MNTRSLEDFLVLSQEKNISRAAELLYISQPSLSRNLQNLETEVGSRLFERNHGNMELTDAGKIFFDGAMAILAEKRVLEHRLGKLRNDYKQKIYVMIEPDFAYFMTRHVFPFFQTANPNIELKVSEAESTFSVEYLLGGLCEIAVMRTHDENPVLNYHTVYQDEIYLVIPNALNREENLKKYREIGLAAFRDQCFYLNRSGDSRVMEREILKQHQFTPPIICEVNGVTKALQFVKKEQGVALLPRGLVRSNSDGVTALPFNPAYLCNIYAVLPGQTPPSKAVKSLLRILKQQFKDSDEYLSGLKDISKDI
ncbi:MAG: LysR family transcriptional regulator [Lachnospiraceae bacterium]|nr:LysR family transcriptional regulator [Lachnospiraceae bacterium]